MSWFDECEFFTLSKVNSCHHLCLLSNKVICILLIHEQPCYGNTCLAGYAYCYASYAIALCYPIIPANTPSTSLTAYNYPSSTPITTPSNPDIPSSHEGSSDHESHGSSANLKPKKTTTLPRKKIGGIVGGLVAFFAALAAGIWRWKKRRSRVSESGAPGDLSEEHHGPPEYFRQPEVQIFPVSGPSPGFSPQR